jgi:hypothetical protein
MLKNAFPILGGFSGGMYGSLWLKSVALLLSQSIVRLSILLVHDQRGFFFLAVC